MFRSPLAFSLLVVALASCQHTTPPQSTPSSATTRSATTAPAIDAIAPAAQAFKIDARTILCSWEDRTHRTALVEYPMHRDLLARQITAPIRLLPEDSRAAYRFASVAPAHSIVRATPERRPGDRNNLTDLLQNEEVWVLDRLDAKPVPVCLIQSTDGYIGFVDEGDLLPIEAADFTKRLQSHTSDSAQSRIKEVIQYAHSLTGTKYVWGGKTKEGIDCSGLTQTAYARIGLRLPRDADMQSSVGRLVATRWHRDGLLPGDLLFFISPRRGNVHHVALYIGGGRYIEAAGAGVHTISLLPAAADFDPKRESQFAFARRVLE